MKNLHAAWREVLMDGDSPLTVAEYGSNDAPMDAEPPSNAEITIATVEQVQPPFTVYQAQLTVSFFNGMTLAEAAPIVHAAIKKLTDTDEHGIQILGYATIVGQESELDDDTGEQLDNITFSFFYQ